MTFMNVVHMRVKPGCEGDYLRVHEEFDAAALPGCLNFRLVKAGERDFIVIGEWRAQADMAAARPQMIGNLDRLRPLLEDLGGGRGMTEPWSGAVVLDKASDGAR